MAAPLEISGGEPQGSPTIKIMQELIHIKWTQDFSCIYWLFSGCIWIGTEAEQWLLHQYERLQVLPKATVVVCLLNVRAWEITQNNKTYQHP